MNNFSGDLKKAVRAAGAIIGHVLRGECVRYGVFAGTNNFQDARLAVAALVGRLPLVDGPAIAEYESRFAEVAGTLHAFSFAAGRMALYALLRALDIGPGDEVILPAFTCVVVPNAILYCGAKPVFVDIDPRTYNIDANQVRARITPCTRAIIVQHTFGLLCDIDSVNGIAREHGLPVLEDCAHALGAKYNDRPVGSLGTAAYFSTDHTKIISTGTGGMVTTNDAILAERIASIHQDSPFLHPAQIRRTLAALVSEILWLHPAIALVGNYVHAASSRLGLSNAFFRDELMTTHPTDYAYPARLSNAQAAIGLRQLNALEENLAARRRLAKLYENELGVYGDSIERDSTNSSFLRYTFMVEDRAAWQRHFEGVLDMNPWFTSVVHGRLYDLHEVGYVMGSCPNAERAARHCVNLPTHLRIGKPEHLLRPLRRAIASKEMRLRLLRDGSGC